MGELLSKYWNNIEILDPSVDSQTCNFGIKKTKLSYRIVLFGGGVTVNSLRPVGTSFDFNHPVFLLGPSAGVIRATYQAPGTHISRMGAT